MSNLIDKEKVIELLIDEMENWHFIIDKTFLEGAQMKSVKCRLWMRCRWCAVRDADIGTAIVAAAARADVTA